MGFRLQHGRMGLAHASSSKGVRNAFRCPKLDFMEWSHTHGVVRRYCASQSGLPVRYETDEVRRGADAAQSDAAILDGPLERLLSA